MIKNLKKAIRDARRIDGFVLASLFALALIIPIDIIVGDWIRAFCNCLWIYIGVRWYKMREATNNITAEFVEINEAQDRLIKELMKLLQKPANEQAETENAGKEAEQ